MYHGRLSSVQCGPSQSADAALLFVITATVTQHLIAANACCVYILPDAYCAACMKLSSRTSATHNEFDQYYTLPYLTVKYTAHESLQSVKTDKRIIWVRSTFMYIMLELRHSVLLKTASKEALMTLHDIDR